VLVCTVRALKMHGGGPRVAPGKALDKAYTEKNVPLVQKGIENLLAHLETIKMSGIEPVVCINHFATDSDEEVAAIRKAATAAGARVALSRHWELGGAGAKELAETVIDACNQKPKFKFLYEESTPLSERIRLIATKVYGADGVSFTPAAKEKVDAIEADKKLARLGTCMVKTHLSLSHDPTVKGRPKGWTLPIRDVLVYRGAGFVVPVAGDIKLMPGTASDPAFRNIDVDTATGKVKGLF
jgi:formyltetrahydrofolate synthetase